MTFTCIIIDDEPLAHEILERYISKFSSLQLTATFTDAQHALAWLHDTEADLMFLDINMPEIDGITFLKSLKTPPVTIFTTAYRDYAIDGYELNVVDFLLKPFAFDRFARAVEKAMGQLKPRKGIHEMQTTSMGEQQDFIFLKSGTRTIKLHLTSVLYIEAMKDYLNIQTTGQRIVIKNTMKMMEKSLPADRFIRVHKSYIVSRPQILSIKSGQIELGEKLIPVGRSYQELVTRMMQVSKP